jgi:hypothetical protein
MNLVDLKHIHLRFQPPNNKMQKTGVQTYLNANASARF